MKYASGNSFDWLSQHCTTSHCMTCCSLLCTHNNAFTHLRATNGTYHPWLSYQCQHRPPTETWGGNTWWVGVVIGGTKLPWQLHTRERHPIYSVNSGCIQGCRIYNSPYLAKTWDARSILQTHCYPFVLLSWWVAVANFIPFLRKWGNRQRNHIYKLSVSQHFYMIDFL